MSDNQFSQEETVDIKAIFLKYSQYWYFFTLSVVICLFLAFLYNRYTPPTYGASTSILIRDDNNTSLGAENLLEGLELFSGKKNIENEIGILQSYDITKETLKKLYFNISYFHVGQIRAAEIYRQKPFVVTIDSTHLQTLKVPYKIVFISNDEFELYYQPQVDLKTNEIAPNLGWKILNYKNNKTNFLFKKINVKPSVYFIHSYFVEIKNKAYITSTINFGMKKITTSIQYKNLYGVQFHPEKSDYNGIKMIKNFLSKI